MLHEARLGGKHIFIVREHKLALLCWKAAYDRGAIGARTTLVHIDMHTDFTFNPAHEQRSKSLLMMTEADARAFVSTLASDNSEFIVCAMLADLIGDGLCVYGRRCKDFGKFTKGSGLTTDKLSVDGHSFYLCSTQNIGGLTDPGSYLASPLQHLDTYSLFHRSPSIILDIDLDFFTYLNDQVYLKCRKDIEAQLRSKAFRMLWEKAAVVTIALEPECCGGSEQCREILALLNEMVLKPEGASVAVNELLL